MKRAARAKKWAELVVQFHCLNLGHGTIDVDENGKQTFPQISEHLVFADACNCGGRLHSWGDRVDDVRCPARNTKRQKARMDALGEVIHAR